VRTSTIVATLEPSEYPTSMLGTGWDGGLERKRSQLTNEEALTHAKVPYCEVGCLAMHT
jgi:hypothetical protein